MAPYKILHKPMDAIQLLHCVRNALDIAGPAVPA
jgi:hypothetical protein